MKVHNPLDKVLNSEIKIKTLRFLCTTEAEWSGRQIAKEIRVSPASCHTALRELHNEGLLLLKTIGRNYLYHLNRKNIIISKLIKPLYQMERKLPGILFNTIKNNLSVIAKTNIISLAVFGSLAQEKERSTSDIDILVLLEGKKNQKAVVKEFEKINKGVLLKFGNAISPYFQSIKEFKLKYKKDLPLTKDILQSHKMLFGKPLRESL